MAVTAAIIAAAGTVGGSAIASGAAHDASNAQVNQSNNAINAVLGQQQNSLDFARQQWQTQQQNMQPWVQYGSGALKTLGGLMGISPDTSVGGLSGPGQPGQVVNGVQVGGSAPGAPPVNTGAPVAPPIRLQGGGGQPSTMRQLYNPTPTAPPAGGAPTSSPQGVGMPPQRLASPPPSSSSQTSTGSRTVKIQWPDGSQNDVTAEQVAKYQQLGAEVLT
jgi:hypothetical protein